MDVHFYYLSEYDIAQLPDITFHSPIRARACVCVVSCIVRMPYNDEQHLLRGKMHCVGVLSVLRCGGEVTQGGNIHWANPEDHPKRGRRRHDEESG
jgi:hypothetical protein